MAISLTPTVTGAGGTPQDVSPRIISGKSFRLSGPATIEPPYISKLELDLSGKTEQLTDQCGRTETRKNGTSNWSLTVEGIISNRELDAFKTLGNSSEPKQASCKLHTGQVIVEEATVTLDDDLNGISFPGQGYDGTEDAMEFQLQLKQPSSESSGSGGVIPNFS